MPADAVTPRFRLEDLLAEGRDPPTTILQAAAALEDDGQVVLDAPFDPAPLRHLLTGQGLDAQSVAQPGGRWHLHVRQGNGAPAAPVAPADGGCRSSFWLEDGRLTLDVRDLPPPRPMMEILRIIDTGLAGTEMVAHVPHTPVHLFPELEDRGWTWDILSDNDAGTAVLLTRDDAP